MVGECIDHGRFGSSYLFVALGGGCVVRSRGLARPCSAAARSARSARRSWRCGRRLVLARAGTAGRRRCPAWRRAALVRRDDEPLWSRRPARGPCAVGCGDCHPVPAGQRRGARASARRRRRVPARGLHSRRHRPLQRGARPDPRASPPCRGRSSASNDVRLSQLRHASAHRLECRPLVLPALLSKPAFPTHRSALCASCAVSRMLPVFAVMQIHHTFAAETALQGPRKEVLGRNHFVVARACVTISTYLVRMLASERRRGSTAGRDASGRRRDGARRTACGRPRVSQARA